MKTLFAVAALIFTTASTVHAQEAVNIYGNITGGLSRSNNLNNSGDADFRIGSVNAYNTNTLGVKGGEKIGDGLRVHFKLESGFNIGNGALDGSGLFNQVAVLGVETVWGDVDMGRQHTVAYKVMGAYDPLELHYPQLSLSIANSAGQYENNSIQYMGKIGKTTVLGGYAVNEMPSRMFGSSSRSFGLLHQAGKLSLGGAYTEKRDTNDLQVTHATVGAAYKMDSIRLSAGFANENTELAGLPDQTMKTTWAGLSYDITPTFTVTGAWYRAKSDAPTAIYLQKNVYSISGAYFFSKRTNVYTIINQNKLDGQTSLPRERQIDISVGVNHNF